MQRRKSERKLAKKCGAMGQTKFGPMNNLEQENLNLENRLAAIRREIDQANLRLKETEEEIGEREEVLFEEFQMMESLAGYESLEHLLYREFGSFLTFFGYYPLFKDFFGYLSVIKIIKILSSFKSN